ncbi:hypothetical protein Egran_02397 [Elaphomyces granulatus]|uniref:Uncharacterized protein n=1 Tax=Elaphomyces granulatus TaxID=519963 RepID=A0A232M0B4_9EURO|nr:hypothetical protein Egran_02397 [Elaphomyces granulatus]
MATANGSTSTPTAAHYQPPKRLLILQETVNPQNQAEPMYMFINAQGLPICGPGPELPSILELPLRTLKAFTVIFNGPKYQNWAIVGAGRYDLKTSDEGKFYAVVLEQVREQISVPEKK